MTNPPPLSKAIIVFIRHNKSELTTHEFAPLDPITTQILNNENFSVPPDHAIYKALRKFLVDKSDDIEVRIRTTTLSEDRGTYGMVHYIFARETGENVVRAYRDDSLDSSGCCSKA